jgi:hypothetical protein
MVAAQEHQRGVDGEMEKDRDEMEARRMTKEKKKLSKRRKGEESTRRQLDREKPKI